MSPRRPPHRPKELPDAQIVSLRLPNEMYDACDKEARKRRIPLSVIFREAIAKFIHATSVSQK
jgi:predicted transcriptional regulator